MVDARVRYAAHRGDFVAFNAAQTQTDARRLFARAQSHARLAFGLLLLSRP